MLNVGFLAREPQWAQPFEVLRAAGLFTHEGAWVETVVSLQFFGVIHPASSADRLAYLPEGERLHPFIVVYCKQEIFLSHADKQRSDVVVWQARKYRVTAAKYWDTHGYWQAWGTGDGGG